MSINKFTIKILGDYVDSFIYSGHLFLVDTEYQLTIFKWDEIFNTSYFCENYDQSNSLKELLKNSRKPIPKGIPYEIEIPSKILLSAKRHQYDIDVWPSDINIFANKLYISSENGIEKMDFDYHVGALTNKLKIFDSMCYSLSPNSLGRLAFAAGKEGVLTLMPMSKFYSTQDVRQLIPGTCLDLDWQSTTLVASTSMGVVEATFAPMPRKEDFDNDSDYWESVKERKKVAPSMETKSVVHSAWLAGDKIYSLYLDGRLEIRGDEKVNNRTLDLSHNLLRARTAAFGTILETNSELIVLTGEMVEPIAKNPVSWRVFPRARDYANQLHVIQDDHISITIIESIDDNDFGFDTDRIDLLG